MKKSMKFIAVLLALAMAFSIASTAEYRPDSGSPADKISGYFTQVSNGTVTAKNSTEYNHPLATWASRLSYCAYQLKKGEGSWWLSLDEKFGADATIITLLEDSGFEEENIQSYNTGRNDATQHIIAHRDIAAAGGARPLIVVTIRGSATFLGDWVVNIFTALGWKPDFATQKGVVLENLDAYLGDHGMKDKEPIFLITGHSHGAAVGNLLAAHLNDTMGCENIYAYTFATPNVQDGGKEPFGNIFNIMNRNDVVTWLPNSTFGGRENTWIRHGVDYHIDMPIPDYMPISQWIAADPTGFFGHHPAVYVNWMERKEERTQQEMDDISEDCPVGFLPRLIYFK